MCFACCCTTTTTLSAHRRTPTAHTHTQHAYTHALSLAHAHARTHTHTPCMFRSTDRGRRRLTGWLTHRPAPGTVSRLSISFTTAKWKQETLLGLPEDFYVESECDWLARCRFELVIYRSAFLSPFRLRWLPLTPLSRHRMIVIFRLKSLPSSLHVLVYRRNFRLLPRHDWSS